MLTRSWSKPVGTIKPLACRLLALALAVAGWSATLEASGQSCVAPPSGLLAWWPGDGNSLDIAGGNNGQLVGGAAFTPGLVGQAFSLDGLSGYVLVTNSPALDSMSNLTVMAWVRPTALSGAPDEVGIILNKEVGSTTSGDIQWELGRRNTTSNKTGSGIPAGNLAFYLGGVTGLPDESDGWVDGNGPLALNAWTHVALTYDGSTVRAFINSVQTRQISVSGAPSSTQGKVRIGARSLAPPASCFAGAIDEPAVFNRALSTNEIVAIYTAGSLGMCKPLILAARWSPPNFSLSFESVSNQSYAVERNTNLATTDWVLQTNVVGDGSILQVTTPVNDSSQRFFRVRRP